MPNMVEWHFGDKSYADMENDADIPWQPYSRDPQQAYEQFHERMREVDKIIIAEPASDGRQLLDEIRMLSETRHDAPEPEQRGPRSYRSP